MTCPFTVRRRPTGTPMKVNSCGSHQLAVFTCQECRHQYQTANFCILRSDSVEHSAICSAPARQWPSHSTRSGGGWKRIFSNSEKTVRRRCGVHWRIQDLTLGPLGSANGDVSAILAPSTNVQTYWITYLLTYLHTYSFDTSEVGVCLSSVT